MSLLHTPCASFLLSAKTPKPTVKPFEALPFSSTLNPRSRASSIRLSYSSLNEPSDPKPSGQPISGGANKTDGVSDNKPSAFVDEWGEKSEPETQPATKFADSDPPKDEDEWGGNEFGGNGTPEMGSGEDERLQDLKRCLVDTVYGTDLGFRASTEIRAEALELVSQLEAANPTPAPTESPELLDGNWILLFTAFSELLPLLAAGNIPSVKVEKISQLIDTSSLTIENSISLSSPVATLSFSATATFEVRTPSRIQVEFKEGSFKPPEIKSRIDLPENVDIFGQKINLSPVQQSLGPVENAVAGIARTISGQPPIKVPIPGERSKSWLLTTYLDKDMRISRGDGGLFVLVKEGSPLVY
ncbi:plastoglobulin-1, chloroplastic [Ipomoea triloba]|uniref:plastoglobulin-1, chloroplastic n=1 Tax=Ipomoea triloba TaxID=35885 RepID=UPI00125D266E|nr:plastoglobulin-1, chloroplastic [Ipomoea triloba]